MVGDRKLAGLLAERDGDAPGASAPGCNVNWASFPADLAATATACNLEAGHPVDRDALLDRVPRRARPPARRAGRRCVGEYRARLATLGRRVRVEPGAATICVGTAIDVTDDGALVVRDDAGADHTVTTADVVHLRPE